MRAPHQSFQADPNPSGVRPAERQPLGIVRVYISQTGASKIVIRSASC